LDTGIAVARVAKVPIFERMSVNRAPVFWITLFLAGVAFAARAQDTLINVYLETWRISDTSQCYQAQRLYDRLTAERDTLRYKVIIQKLYAWLKQNPDKRLEARTILYEALGAKEFAYAYAPYTHRLEEAIKMAHELEDEQLTAEIYSLLAGMSDDSGYLLYNLKAIELQQKVGFSHFPYVYSRFFDVSRALYLTQEYRQSIAYGLKCLSFRGHDPARWDSKVLVFQFDMLGAAFKKLGQYDSAAMYYRQILEVLPETDMEPGRRELWAGIARGNIGHVLALQHRFSDAMPLLQAYAQSSTALRDEFNMALAQNALAEAYRLQGNSTAALAAWRLAYQASLRAPSLDNAVRATGGIADIHKQTGSVDSAYHYYNLYHTYKDSLAEDLSHRRLSAMQARMDFDELQSSLNKAQARLTEMNLIRDRTLLVLGVACVLAFWIYNRRRVKQKHVLQLMKQRQEEAEREMHKARELAASIASQIVERNRLVDTLKQKITAQVKELDQELLTQALGEYTCLAIAIGKDLNRISPRLTRIFYTSCAGRLNRSPPRRNAWPSCYFFASTPSRSPIPSALAKTL
jgi:tetratricopeptide (TPR) repeat protein